jgi:hypothetical protein
MIVEDSPPTLAALIVPPNPASPNHIPLLTFDVAYIEQSPVAYGSLQIFDSFSLSHLCRYSTFNFEPEDHINDALRGPTHPLEEEDPVSTSPASWTAVVEDSDTDLGQGMTATLADEDDEALVRMSIKSLDVGEEPVFDLPSGWREAFVSPIDVTVPRSSQVEGTKKRSVLPKLKSLWKRAASKFVSR